MPPTDSDRSIPSSRAPISAATARNWARLRTNASAEARLVSRANKQCSAKRIEPTEYLTHPENLASVRAIVDYADRQKLGIPEVLLSLGLNFLMRAGLQAKPHVVEVLREYRGIAVDEYLATVPLPTDETDLLGLVYQCLLSEGHKNRTGSYYTPKIVVDRMLGGFSFENGETLLDPCCGSGSFLLAAPAPDLKQLFGTDIDPTAVMIAKVNLLLKYRDVEFVPQVYVADFCEVCDAGGRDADDADDDDADDGNEEPFPVRPVLPRCPFQGRRFDYVVTNPPWGAKSEKSTKRAKNSKTAAIRATSEDSFARIFRAAFSVLTEDGAVRFLFPEAILNVKSHKAVRDFALEKGLSAVTHYDALFSGVTTRYVDLECRPGRQTDAFVVRSGSKDADEREAREAQIVPKSAVFETRNHVLNFWTAEDLAIVRRAKALGAYDLTGSIWGLGIVTGDNKGKLLSEPSLGTEPIYTGKEIEPYRLRPARHHIVFDRHRLQQAAPDAVYRAPEKLVYKFISKRLVFAYDAKGCLCLNSANILIPSVPSMGIKTVMAFLNSSVFAFLHAKLFGEVKVLKGNLTELSFPHVSEEIDARLARLADDVLAGNDAKRAEIDALVFAIYGFGDDEIRRIRSVVEAL